MKCKCGNDIAIQLGTNITTKGCKVLTSLTTIITVQCEKCKAIIQVPLSSKSVLSGKEDK